MRLDIVMLGSPARREMDEDRLALLQMLGDLDEVGETDHTVLAEQHRWPTVACVWGVLRHFAHEPLERRRFVQFR